MHAEKISHFTALTGDKKDLFTPLYSIQMISEYREVLSRSKFGFSDDEVLNAKAGR
jgi:hypothetical protein